MKTIKILLIILIIIIKTISNVFTESEFNLSLDDGTLVLLNDTEFNFNISEFGNFSNFTNITFENISDQEATSIAPELSTPENVVDGTGLFERNLELQDFCTCDLTAFSCDMNCCCDLDCIEDDKKAFSHCKPGDKYIDKLYCFEEYILYANNTPYKAKAVSTDLLCIVTDNLKDKHFFPNVKGVDTAQRFRNLMKGIQKYKWEERSVKRTTNQYSNIVGEFTFVTEEEGIITPFELPSSFSSRKCGGKENIFYLQDFEDSCKIPLKNLQYQCEKDSSFSIQQYENLYFVSWIQEEKLSDEGDSMNDISTTIAPSTATFIPTNITLSNSTNTDEIELATSTSTTERSPTTTQGEEEPRQLKQFNAIPLKILLCNDIFTTTDCYEPEVIPTPLYHRGECKNVLRKIEFTFIHNGSDGIDEVTAKIQLQSLHYNMNYIDQYYKVVFEWFDTNKTNVYSKSGSPGYIPGKPVLMGSLRTFDNGTEELDQESKIYLDKNSNNWLTILTMGENQICDRRRPVNFGDNIYSSCELMVKFNKTQNICKVLRNRTLSSLIGPLYDPENVLRIGMFGDSNVVTLIDWIPIIVSEELENLLFVEDKDTYPGDDYCTKIVTSIEIEIAYAYQGPFQNPQRKIVGVFMKLGKTSKVDLQMYTNLEISKRKHISSDLFIHFDLVTIVNFEDITKDSKREYPKPPTFDLKLPYDFFYPFLPSISCSNQSNNVFIVFTIVINNFLHNTLF